MVATLPWPPYINMIPEGFTADGSVTYRMTGGIFAEVFDTLQVSDASVNDGDYLMVKGSNSTGLFNYISKLKHRNILE